MKATIVTIGDELLIGQVVDTNSAYIARELNKTGISVHQRIAVGDAEDEIIEGLKQAAKCSGIVIITGGLGPTSDDITKPTLCKYFNCGMKHDEATEKFVIEIFQTKYGREPGARNLLQAQVPEKAVVLPNALGTAPGMMFFEDRCYYFSLPGVPFEMMGLMQKQVLPVLRSKFSLRPLLHKTLVTYGIGESAIADEIADIEAQMPGDVSLAYLPNLGLVRLRLSGTDEVLLNEFTDRIKERVSKFLIAEQDMPVAAMVQQNFITKGLSLATAESCTGGNIGRLITAEAGSSEYYKGGVVVYSNELKQQLLDVQKETLETQGAVSEETVREMLQGLLKTTGADYGIAVSGIMGPGGGSADKPVGTVFIGVANAERAEVRRLQLFHDREKNIERTSIEALVQLLRFANTF